MKRYFIIFILLFLNLQKVFSCDLYLANYQRDCAIQDRFNNARKSYADIGINIDEIGEYKALRFIDRSSWEKAKILEKSPLEIYEPAPTTWMIWEQGIDKIFKHSTLKNSLYNNNNLDDTMFSYINTILLTKDDVSIKDKASDQNLQPGVYRSSSDKIVGFCASPDLENRYKMAIYNSEYSLEVIQNRWELLTGFSFSEIIKKHHGPNPLESKLKSGMQISVKKCNVPDRITNGVFVNYSPSYQVQNQIEWLRIFINENIELYRLGKPTLAPVEFAAVIQKIFVSIHPFADGNGRTSRAIQDLLLAHFGLPFAPSGDLQNDALETVDRYVENTYLKTESMLTKLEMCLNSRLNNLIPKGCKTISELK